MNISLIYGFLAVITLVHNYMCYKKKNFLRPLSKRPLLVVNNEFYKLQFKFGNIATVVFVLIAVGNSIASNRTMSTISLIVTILSIGALSLLLEDMGIKKGYIKEKK